MSIRTLIRWLILISLTVLVLVQVVFYAQYSALTRERADNLAASIVNQVGSQLDVLSRNIVNSAEMISFNKHVQEFIITTDMTKKFITLHPFVRESLQNVKAANLNIKDLLIVNTSGKILSSVDAYEFDIIERLKKEHGFNPGVISQPFTSAAILNEGVYYQAYLYPIKSTMTNRSLFEHIGYCLVIMRTDVLQQLVSDIAFTPESHLFIADSRDLVIASNISDDIGKNREDIRHGMPNNDDALKQSKVVADGIWSIHSYMPRGDLTRDMSRIVNSGMVICTVVGIFLMLIWILFSNSISRSILTLVSFLRTAGENPDKAKRAHVEGKNEISMISESVNAMLDKINAANHQIVETQSQYYGAQIRQKQSELSMLQSQINPHFLYNTLNCMSSIGLANGIGEIATIASAMSKIFRYSIKEADVVTVRQEIDIVLDYLKIMNIRYPDKFTCIIDTDPAIDEYLMPKMILQPIVENALNHGIGNKLGKGSLRLNGKIQEDGVVAFSVTDDGNGISNETLRKLTADIANIERDPNRPMGLVNIHERLRILFGDTYGVRLESIQGEGTSVFVEFPVTEKIGVTQPSPYEGDAQKE